MVSNEGLLNRFIDGTIRRNICAEVCIPSYLKDNKMHCVALRSEASGNCMYSSASLFFVADNTLMDVLRVLTSLEIYIHADYYLSHSALDSGFENNNIIKAEAIANCESTEKWAVFLCLLGLSSVLSCNIVSCYPDFGVEKYKIFFNQEISPRTPIKFCSPFYILFCYDGNFQSGTFQHNHYVPLIFIPKKRKLSSKSKTIISKKLLPVLSPNKFLDTKQTTIDQVATIVPSTEAKNPNKKPYSILTFFHKTNPDLEPTSAVLQNTSCILKSNSFSSQLAVSSSQSTTSFQSLTLNKDISSHSKTSKDSVLSKSFFTKSSSIRKVPNFYNNNNIECPSNIILPPKETRKLTHLYLEPFNKWSDAIRSFSNHESTKNGLHAFTMPVFNIFLSRSSGISQPINVIIDTNVKEKIIKNRQILRPIVDAIIFCGQTNTPLRGHRDDSQYLPEAGEYSKCGTGCFNKLLNFAVRNGYDVLGSHLNNCSKNASYISKTSQNEINKCCGEEISKSILSEVRKNVFFSIFADEACDSSTKEQMSLVLRFVDSDFNIREDFIQFIDCSEGVKGKDLFNVLLNCVSNLNLDIKNCRGQGYDGASSVSGYINGLSAQVLNLNSKALYTHCHSHRLNLSVCESCNVQLVSEVFNKVRELSYFFNYSENRQKFLEGSILEREPQTHKKKLKDICRTRWIERIDGLNTFLEHYLSIFHALCIMASPESSVNKDTQNKSSTFLNSIGTFHFVFTLVVTTRVFDFTLPVTRLLQSKTIDILDGLHLITALKNTFISIRNDIDSFHNNCYEAACLLSSKAEISVLKPRTCSIQKNRSNVPSESVSDYFKRAVTIPLIDHVSTSISTRFKSETVAAYKGLSIIPFNIISFLKRPKTQLCWRKQFETFCDFFIDDFPNISALNKELIALRILGTLPVTSCECERSFSVMRRLKDYMRTTMSEDRLNGLALMYIHQEIVPCIDNVINRFSIKNRRLDFND
nr:52 kDa repressor of the inhibitor of the protein kinase-like [Hydra vulgaris]